MTWKTILWLLVIGFAVGLGLNTHNLLIIILTIVGLSVFVVVAS